MMTKEEEQTVLETPADLIRTLGEQNKLLKAKLVEAGQLMLILACALDRVGTKEDVQSELIKFHDSTTEYMN